MGSRAQQQWHGCRQVGKSGGGRMRAFFPDCFPFLDNYEENTASKNEE